MIVFAQYFHTRAVGKGNWSPKCAGFTNDPVIRFLIFSGVRNRTAWFLVDSITFLTYVSLQIIFKRGVSLLVQHRGGNTRCYLDRLTLLSPHCLPYVVGTQALPQPPTPLLECGAATCGRMSWLCSGKTFLNRNRQRARFGHTLPTSVLECHSQVKHKRSSSLLGLRQS